MKTTISIYPKLLQNRPTTEGLWLFRVAPTGPYKLVKVEVGSASGIYCKELRMGGSAQCGFGPWSGYWEKTKITPRDLLMAALTRR